MANANTKASTDFLEANDAMEIAGNIMYHSKYSPHFSPSKFGPEQALNATAESLCDRLVQLWNETYLHFNKVDPKQKYYLSMEYLQDYEDLCLCE